MDASYEERILSLLDSILLKLEALDGTLNQISGFFDAVVSHWFPIACAGVLCVCLILLIQWVVKL